MDGGLYRERIGKYINYSISVDTSLLDLEEYDRLYEILTDPTVDSHQVTMPYGQSEITFDAYCSSVEDSLIRTEYGKNFWGGMSWKFIAIDPFQKA